MGIDASLYGNLGRGVRSVADYDNEARAAKLNDLQLLAAQSQYDQGQRAIQDDNALRAMTLTGDDAADYTSMRRISPKAADTYRKAQLDAKKTQGDIDKAGAETASKKIETKIKAHDFHIQQLGSLTDPSQIDAWAAQGVRDGVLGMQASMEGARQMKEFAAQNGFEAAKQQALRGGMSAMQQLQAAHSDAVLKETGRHNVAGEELTASGQAETARSHRVNESIAGGHLTLARNRAAQEGQGTYDADRGVIIDKKDGTFRPVTAAADGTPLGGKSDGKPLPAPVVKSITEARDNAQTIERLQTSFKDDYANKGIFGLGADASLAAKATVGADKDSVEWWKNYRKQAELVERHALFGASLTPGEQGSWRSADISPGMDKAVIKKNLETRSRLAQQVADFARQDQIDAGHNPERIDKIAGRKPTPKGGPALGSVEGGYKFKGGDPADKANWEKV